MGAYDRKTQKADSGTGEMDQWVKVFDAKLGSLSSITRTHRVERED